VGNGTNFQKKDLSSASENNIQIRISKPFAAFALKDY